MNYQRIHSFNGVIGSNITQKLATALSKPVNNAIFKGTKIHYRKYGSTDSFEDKKSNTGIIYNDKDGIVKVMGRIMKLKPIRKTDIYMMEALKNKVKYCRVIRKPFNNKYKYFLQLVMEGIAPKKLKAGTGRCGLDEGTSTIAYYTEKESNFYVLAENVNKYEKEILRCQQKYERSRRINNSNNYNDDGTIKKGSKFKNSHNNLKNLMQLKNAYRKKSTYIKQKHNYVINRFGMPRLPHSLL